MKSFINKNKNSSLTEYPFVKLDTQTLLSNYVKQFGLGYVIRHYEISSELVKQITDGDYSDICDEMYTTSEIIQFQQTLLSLKKTIQQK